MIEGHMIHEGTSTTELALDWTIGVETIPMDCISQAVVGLRYLHYSAKHPLAPWHRAFEESNGTSRQCLVVMREILCLGNVGC